MGYCGLKNVIERIARETIALALAQRTKLLRFDQPSLLKLYLMQLKSRKRAFTPRSCVPTSQYVECFVFSYSRHGDQLGLLKKYIAQEAVLSVSENGLVVARSGNRTILKDEDNGYSLEKHLSNELPYHYRTVEGITADFAMGHHALEALLAIASSLPTSKNFRNSHCGEILAAHFIQQELGYERLYSKLTMITSQNTNAHKMDALFVDIKCSPYEYLFVEAKCSILPTPATPTKSHKSGILKQMIESLDAYSRDDPRFELSRIRDNLEKSFQPHIAKQIRADLIPPGPKLLKVMGVSVTNIKTINSLDDDFILTEKCPVEFDYHAIAVTDVACLADKSFGRWDKIKEAGN